MIFHIDSYFCTVYLQTVGEALDLPRRVPVVFTGWPRLWEFVDGDGYPRGGGNQSIIYIYCIRGRDRGRRQISILGPDASCYLQWSWQNLAGCDGRTKLSDSFHPSSTWWLASWCAWAHCWGTSPGIWCWSCSADSSMKSYTILPWIWTTFKSSTYIHRRAVSMDVYDIGNVRSLCQPIGNHECLIHHDEQVLWFSWQLFPGQSRQLHCLADSPESLETQVHGV